MLFVRVQTIQSLFKLFRGGFYSLQRQSRGADEDNTGGAAAADQSTEGDQAPLPEKKSLFQRIFGRKRRF